MARPNSEGKIVCTGCDRSLPGTVKYYHRHRDAFKPRCKECRGSSFGISHINKIVETGDGEKICATCRRVLSADSEHFYRSQKTGDGYASQCKECHGGRDGEFGVDRPNRSGVTPGGESIPEGMWFCPSCEQTLPLNDRYFYRNGDKYEKHCKPCSTQRRNQARRADDDDLSGKVWRFIKANWLEAGVVRCAYCGEEAESPERDHVQPLSNGGKTVAENIVPACKSCNRSKGPRLATEWYPDSDAFSPGRWEKIQSHMRGETPLPE